MNQNFKPMFDKHVFSGASWCYLGFFISALLCSLPTRAQTYGDPLFAAAMQHVDDQEWVKAEALLEFQLSQNKDLHRARVELALVYAKQDKLELANKHLDLVLVVDDLPDNVRANIYHLRQKLGSQPVSLLANQASVEKDVALEEKEWVLNDQPGHRLKSYAEVSLGYDSNVRFSSDDYFVQDNPFDAGIFFQDDNGVLLFLAPDGFIYDQQGNQTTLPNNALIDLGVKDPNNAFYSTALNFDHSYSFGGEKQVKWYNQVNILASENAEFSNYNKFQLKLNTGINWLLSEQVKADVSVFHRLLKRDGLVQVRDTKVNPAMTYYNHFGSWELGFNWQQRKYEDTTFTFGDLNVYHYGFDTSSRTLSAKWSNLFFDNNLLLLGKLEYQDSNASDGLDNKATKATAVLLYSFAKDWKWQVSASRLLRDYTTESTVTTGNSAITSVIGEHKKDRSITFKSRLSYNIDNHWQAFLSAERGMRRSAIYDGEKRNKTQINLGLRLSF